MSWKRAHKYGARKTLCSLNHPHPSALEASVCQMMQLRERGGHIRNLKWQHTVTLAFGVKWKVDWSFELAPDWMPNFAEAKGAETADYKLKVRMWAEGAGPGPLEIWKGSHRKPVLVKTIYPKRLETKEER